MNYFLLKKKVISKPLEEEGLEEVFGDELKKILVREGMQVGSFKAKEAIIDGQKTYIRPGSLKAKGWQITFRDRSLDSLEKGQGYLLVSRGDVLLIPLNEVRKVVTDPSKFKQNTIDVYVVLTKEKTTVTYIKNIIDVTGYKLRKQ